MQRLKALGGYQRTVLLVLAVMIPVFAWVYSKSIAQEGYAYHDAILIPHEENGQTVYSGSFKGSEASFTVGQDKTVTFRYRGNTYGPYTAKEDPSAIPRNEQPSEHMTGLELRRGETLLFRGGVLELSSGQRLLYNTDGTLAYSVVAYGANGTYTDEQGYLVDPVEPSISTVLDLMGTPKLTHKGSWGIWLLGVFVCLITAVDVLFAEELFRWRISFRVRDAYTVEPSEWELASRRISWTALLILALILFMTGLRIQ